MRRLVTSDWQLCDNARDRYRTDFVVKTLPELIQKHRPDQLLVLGDLTEHKDQHPASLVNEVVNTFCSIVGSFEIEIIVLQGNHDFLHNAHPFFAFLENFKGIHWIQKPEVHDRCLYLPHTRDHKKDWKGIDFKGHDYIFAHNIFQGVKANGQELSGISTSIFPDDACVIAGDVHEPQSFDCVTYVGSPCLCDFGDDYRPRVLLLDGTGPMKSIKVAGVQKRLIDIDWDGDNSTFHYEVINAGDIVKLRVNLQMQHVPEWDKIREYVAKWAYDRALSVNTIQPVVAYEVGERAKLVKGKKRNDDEYLSSFVKRNGTDTQTAKVGKDIIDLV